MTPERRAPSLVALLALTAAACAPPRPNVVLIVIDTLRADHLSVYGYERRTSPWLERLAQRGWTFENHISHASQTVPATLSLLLSQVPAEHGVVHRFHGQFGKAPPYYPEGLLFLAEVFGSAGYATAGFVANPFLRASNGFRQGFDEFTHSVVADGSLAGAAVDWLGSREAKPGEPFFLYVHLMETHAPYAPPERFAGLYPRPGDGEVVRGTGRLRVSSEDLAATVSAYDAAINHADELVGALFVELYRLGIADDTILAVTSDHGEEFQEHGGMGHGTTAYGELLRVPLILVYPRRLEAGRRTSHLTQHLDLAPTLLELAGIEKPASFRGASLFTPATAVLAEEGAWRAAYGTTHKLLVHLGDERREIYAVGDTLDQRPLDPSSLPPGLDRELAAYRAREADGPPPADPDSDAAPRWSPEDVERLRELGYVE